jgi:ABC-type cobalamin/Fe3+-siderophores transport system ATPase subunit
MIEIASLSARGDLPTARGAALLQNVSFSWERGVLAVLGAPYDGTTLLLSVLAGRVKPKAGRVQVRGAVAHVPVDVVLPDALRVEEVCELAAELRGEARKPAPERLAPLGLEALAKRRTSSLTPAEARGVSLAIALSSNAPVVLVEEPLAMVEPTVPSRVIDAIRARATSGACVVVTTSSVRDATRLADQLGVLTRGVYAPLPPALAHVGPHGAGVRIVIAPTADARAQAAALVAALTEHASVTSIDTSGNGPTAAATIANHVRGPDLVALASAVTGAIASARVDVEAIETAVMPLDAIRATLAAPRPGALPSRPPPPLSAPPPAMHVSQPPPPPPPPTGEPA